jgi:uncharacterized protein
MIHVDTRLVAIDLRVGVGVVATRKIAAGTIVWARDNLDMRIPDASLQKMPDLVVRQFTRHAYLDEHDEWTLCWDIARFVNHHCDCNSLVTPWGVEIACREIAAGEEISNDYALFRLNADEEFDCCCDSPLCRGRIDSKDVTPHAHQHSLKLATALARLKEVPQPLWPLLSEHQKQQLDCLIVT